MKKFTILVAFLLLIALIFAYQPVQAELTTLGWVGNMFPTGGSTSTIRSDETFTVYVQVWKDGVTNLPGQGAQITCTLHWGRTPAFGEAWFADSITDTPMVYNVDIGNNDEYWVTLDSLPPGLIEFTAFCTDTSDGSELYQQAGNGQLEVQYPDQRGIWVEEAIIGWNTFGGATYELHHDFGGNLNVPATAGSGIALTFAGTANSNSYAKYPNVDGYDLWQIGAGDLATVPTILQSEMAIAAYDGGGNLLDSAELQIQGVLDDLYSYNGELGISWSGNIPTIRVWAPTARNVTLQRYTSAARGAVVADAMAFDAATGVWSVTGDVTWKGQYYTFDVEVFVPLTGNVETNSVTDPYAVNLSQNSLRGQIIDLDDVSLKPTGWDSFTKPDYGEFEDIVLYEVHVRDFSRDDLTVAANHRGTYTAFTYDGVVNGAQPSDGMQHLLDLADAGLTHVHLLPVFDIASVEEDAGARTDPAPTGFARNSAEQQTAIGADRDADSFNWGYDPFHYGVPEGSYATTQNDTARIVEFRQMVQTLNENGLRVVMDVVYNHTSASGQFDQSVLDKIVPGYYYRLANDGTLQTSSCCADTSAEFTMMQKLMIDTLLRWAVDYKVDSFRFDLMNLHTTDNMATVQSAINGLTLVDDGVDGSEIYIYGEGWEFGSALAKGLTGATQFNMAGTGIGTFNDRLRDAVHGGYDTDPLNIRTQGFANGLSYDWNGYFYPNRFQGDLRYQQDRLRIGLAGNLQNFPIIDQNDTPVTGIGLNGTGYALDPQEVVNYVSKHDNETLYDQHVFKLPMGENGMAVTSMEDRVRVQNLSLSVVGLSQGIPFFHLGSDMLRSKSLDRNSYDSGDWFNRVDFTYSNNNFGVNVDGDGVGLPPEWDNAGRWGIMGPLLANTAFDPAPSDIQFAVGHLQEILQIRASSPLFRLQSEAEILSRVDFHNMGSSQLDGLIVMTIADDVGADLDGNYERMIVLFNANKVAQNFALGSLANLDIELHPVLAGSADSIVQTATYTAATGTFTVPARTTAVFVENDVAPTAIQLSQQTIQATNLLFVGLVVGMLAVGAIALKR